MIKLKKFNYKKVYYKVVNDEERHNGLQYKTGLVTDVIPFNSDPAASCVPGGIYFTTLDYIGQFYKLGNKIRPLTIPKDCKDVLPDPSGDKFRAKSVYMKEAFPKEKIFELMPDKIKGSLDLGGCDLKGIKLPQSVGGSLYLGGCDLKGIKLPQNLINKVIS